MGWAETSYEDPTCNSPQLLQFEAFVYDVKSAKITALSPFPGDPDSTGINDKEQITAISGLCANAVGGASARHAVLWRDQNSTPIDLGNLGGHACNTPTSINNKWGDCGIWNASGGENAPFNPIAFLWTQHEGMKNLGTLAQDKNSIAYAINIHGMIVGQSFGGPNGSHAFIDQDGTMTDLNSLKIGHDSLTLVCANDVNDYESLLVVRSTRRRANCSCRAPSVCVRWWWDELKMYVVSSQAHALGYGAPEEIVYVGTSVRNRNGRRSSGQDL